MKKKTLIWKDEFMGDIPVSFRINNYANNNNLYVGLVCHNEGFEEHWCDITINLDEVCPSDCGFVDTNNNPKIDRWLTENGIAEPTGNWGVSGFYIYPEFRFNMEKVREYGKEF